jgi:hypothetical protein
MAETLVKVTCRQRLGVLVRRALGVRGERVPGAAGGWRADILLGPEATSTCGWFSGSLPVWDTAVACGGGWSGLTKRWGFPVLVENCTVDASIFDVVVIA